MVLVSVIERVLQAKDIEGLLELGAPKDEYSHEAKTIASELNKLTPGSESEGEITCVMAKVWAKSFNLSAKDLDKRHPALHSVAREILASWERETSV